MLASGYKKGCRFIHFSLAKYKTHIKWRENRCKTTPFVQPHLIVIESEHGASGEEKISRDSRRTHITHFRRYMSNIS